MFLLILTHQKYYIGEYLGLTGTKIRGAEMVECGLANHFMLSKVMSLRIVLSLIYD
jgi:enoyl-CoA hydratase/carnithine racemase